MQVYAYLGAAAVVSNAPLPWSSVAVALSFSGAIASVSAEHGLQAQLHATGSGASVTVGGAGGPGGTYPGGLAFTVTFTPETDVAAARIDYASSDTSLACRRSI